MHLTAFFDLVLHAIEGAGSLLPVGGRALSQSAAAMAVTAAWQGAAVALGLGLCLRFAPRSPARHRFALWAAGYGTLVALQLLPLISPFFSSQLFAAPVTAATAAAVAPVSHPWLQLSAGWSILIASLWLVASLYRAADLALHSFHLRKLWKTAVPVELEPSASLQYSLHQEGRRPIQVCTTCDLERPSVIGFFAPRILIPDWLFARLTRGELEQIVMHEAEHLRRRDDWTNLLQKLCLVLFPLNPGLAWIERRLCREREMACDDGVIRITHAPRAYAACLTSLAERGLQRRAGALSLGAWSRRPELVGRVHSILRRKHGLSPAAARALVGALGCGLLLGAVALARCPKLVAFVPARKAITAQIQMPAVPTAAQLAPAAPLHAASLPAQPKHRVLRASAQAPAVHHAATRQVALHAHVVPSHTHAQLASITPAEKRPAAKVVTSMHASPNGDRLIVMTTWERIQVTGQPSGETGASTAEAARVTGARTSHADKRSIRQIMVTRLFLRIYPSGVAPDGAAANYAGWLVIQL